MPSETKFKTGDKVILDNDAPDKIVMQVTGMTGELVNILYQEGSILRRDQIPVTCLKKWTPPTA